MQRFACDLIIDAAWVLPIAPENRALSAHSVCVTDGRIVALGPTPDVHGAWEARHRVSFEDGILTPGLVNAHTHAAMTLLRGVGEDLPLERWLRDCIWPLENALVNEDFVAAGTELAVAEMLRRGITTFTDMYFFPETTARVARAAGMRAVLAFPVFEGSTAWSRGVEDCFHLGLALHDACRGDPLVEVAFGPHAPYSVSMSTLEKINMYAQELGLGVHIHLHETAYEVAEARRLHGRSWVHVLGDIGLISPQLQAVHMTQLEDDEIRLLANHGASVIHCPNANMKLADGTCPLTRLVANGVNVAIGTDGAAANNSLDVLADARTAALLAKLQAGDPTVAAAPDMLARATLGGARALGREAQLGSVEPGKLADLVVFVPDSPAALPLYDPFAALLHTGSAFSVAASWVAGTQVVHAGQPRLLDETAMHAHVREQAQRVRAHR